MMAHTAYALAGGVCGIVAMGACAWLLIRELRHPAPQAPQGEVVPASVEAATSTVPSTTDAPAPRPAAQPGQIAVDVDAHRSFVLVLDDTHAVTACDLVAVQVFLSRTYGATLGRHAYTQLLAAYTAHEARDLDTELAALGGTDS